MAYVIEMGDGGRGGYGSIHAANCSDVVDPTLLHGETPMNAAQWFADCNDGWSLEDMPIMPCAKRRN